MPPLFYYAQYDWLKSYQQGKGWSYPNLIPHGIYGFAVTSPYNHLMALALYACISKELGLPFALGGPAWRIHRPLSMDRGRVPREGNGLGRDDRRVRKRDLQLHQWRL